MLTQEAAGNLKESQEIKYIQYIPNAIGRQDVDMDKAIRSLYKRKATNISASPEKRPKFGQRHSNSVEAQPRLQFDDYDRKLNFQDVSGFLYGQQKRTCYGSHSHSRECSKV